MAIIKQVKIETNGVLNDIGAKYDEAENPIRGTYGASLDLPIETGATGGTSIQLVAKDDTILSTVNLELDASVISDGILPVEYGGTGSTTMTHNGVLVGTVVTSNNETSSYARYIENQNGLGGAFYAPADPSSSVDKTAQTPVFGTLPVAYGGTGITSVTPRGIIYAANNGTLASTSSGSDQQVLVSQGNGTNAVPTWKTLQKESITTGYQLNQNSSQPIAKVTQDGILQINLSAFSLTNSGTVEAVVGYAPTGEISGYAYARGRSY